MAKVIRYQVADYMNVAASGESTADYALMGNGFTSLDENPSAKIETTAYISDRSASGTITGYETTFPFDTQLIDDEKAIAFIYDVARNQKTGAEAEADYVRAEIFKAKEDSGYPARKFRVAVEVSSISGAGTEIMRVAGNLHQVGNFTDGTFNVETRTFTPKENI